MVRRSGLAWFWRLELLHRVSKLAQTCGDDSGLPSFLVISSLHFGLRPPASFLLMLLFTVSFLFCPLPDPLIFTNSSLSVCLSVLPGVAHVSLTRVDRDNSLTHSVVCFPPLLFPPLHFHPSVIPLLLSHTSCHSTAVVGCLSARVCPLRPPSILFSPPLCL